MIFILYRCISNSSFPDVFKVLCRRLRKYGKASHRLRLRKWKLTFTLRHLHDETLKTLLPDFSSSSWTEGQPCERGRTLWYEVSVLETCVLLLSPSTRFYVDDRLQGPSLVVIGGPYTPSETLSKTGSVIH